MNTIDFTIKITGVPKKQFDAVCDALKKDFLKNEGVIINPTNNVQCSFVECLECGLDPFYQIVSWALTLQSLQDEIRNGN